MFEMIIYTNWDFTVSMFPTYEEARKEVANVFCLGNVRQVVIRHNGKPVAPWDK